MIDAHHHFWDYDPVEYDWISGEMSAIRQSFGCAELRSALPAEIDGVVTVQVRQSVEENDFMLAAARDCDLVKGIVGWVPLKEESVGEVLDRYADEPLLVGVREICQGEPDAKYLDNSDFDRGLHALSIRNLPYDLLIYENQLAAAIAFVDRHPSQRFVLDHIGKPFIRAGEFSQQWERGIRELAKRENVWCKLSGMVTEVRDPGWNVELLRPYAEITLECFGAKRLMFGSDWPVCLLRSSYTDWHSAVVAFAAGLSESERMAVTGGTACGFYGL